MEEARGGGRKVQSEEDGWGRGTGRIDRVIGESMGGRGEGGKERERECY